LNAARRLVFFSYDVSSPEDELGVVRAGICLDRGLGLCERVVDAPLDEKQPRFHRQRLGIIRVALQELGKNRVRLSHTAGSMPNAGDADSGHAVAFGILR
jgi:hypothetical protein